MLRNEFVEQEIWEELLDCQRLVAFGALFVDLDCLLNASAAIRVAASIENIYCYQF